MHSEVFWDNTSMFALVDHAKSQEYIPMSEFSELSDIKYIYTDAISILLIAWKLELFMKRYKEEIKAALHKLQRWG